MAHFNEAHTRIYIPSRPDDMPPVKAINFGEKIIVGNIAETLSRRIPAGSEILRINKAPVAEYIKDSVYPYISAATVHWKFDKAVTEMFYGAPQTTVIVTIKTPQDEERDVELVRNYHAAGAKEIMAEKEQTMPISIKMLERNIGYIQLSSFQGQYLDTINAVFANHLPQLKKCHGLIIDIRGNRGGTDQAWQNMANHLILEPKFSLQGKWFSRKHVAAYKKLGEYYAPFSDYYKGVAMEEIKHAPYTNKINDSLKLSQPLVLISGQYVGSAAEDFLLVMKETGRACVVGEASVGCVGDPIFIPLPADYGVMICSKKYVSPDGSQPNDAGILPDIEVKRDYNAYLKGKDNVLEQAIKELKIRIKKY
jgi:C-terminal processing protease CtpA/Prc